MQLTTRQPTVAPLSPQCAHLQGGPGEEGVGEGREGQLTTQQPTGALLSPQCAHLKGGKGGGGKGSGGGKLPQWERLGEKVGGRERGGAHLIGACIDDGKSAALLQPSPREHADCTNKGMFRNWLCSVRFRSGADPPRYNQI